MAAVSLALAHSDYPRSAQVVVLPSTNAEADLYFGPVHRSHFTRLRRLDGAGWMQAGLWHFTTGKGGAARQHKTVFAYGIHVFKGKSGASRALHDVKLKTHRSRVAHLYARRFRHSDAQQTLAFVFFTYGEVLVEAYYQYQGAAPASTSHMVRHTFTTQTAHLAALAKKLHAAIHRPPTPTRAPTRTPTATATPSPTATVTATSLPTPTTAPTQLPTATAPIPTATAFVSPTASPTATLGSLVVQAQPTSASYAPGSQATVQVHLARGSQPIARAAVSAIFYLPGQGGVCNTQTDAKGDAQCSISLPTDAPDGTRVDVDVTVQTADGETASTTTFFVIRSG